MKAIVLLLTDNSRAVLSRNVDTIHTPIAQPCLLLHTEPTARQMEHYIDYFGVVGRDVYMCGYATNHNEESQIILVEGLYYDDRIDTRHIRGWRQFIEISRAKGKAYHSAVNLAAALPRPLSPTIRLDATISLIENWKG